MKQSRLVKVVLDDTPMRADAPVHLVANDNYQNYRALLVNADLYDDRLHINAATAAALGVEQGSRCGCSPYCTGETMMSHPALLINGVWRQGPRRSARPIRSATSRCGVPTPPTPMTSPPPAKPRAPHSPAGRVRRSSSANSW